MRIIESWSPNIGERTPGTKIDILLMHYTGMPSAADALARLTDPASKVSAHYVIDETGEIYHLVPEAMRAWHAGISYWAGATDINSHSIGLEIVNPGHEFGYRDFPEVQIAAVETLSLGILKRHAIPASRVIGHSDVAPERKVDPGERFPWARLAKKGIGLWHDRPLQSDLKDGDRAALLKALEAIGYRPVADENAARFVITAFQRHWLPEAIGAADEGRASGRTVSAAREIAATVGRTNGKLKPGA